MIGEERKKDLEAKRILDEVVSFIMEVVEEVKLAFISICIFGVLEYKSM